jgi:hypothetical protein
LDERVDDDDDDDHWVQVWNPSLLDNLPSSLLIDLSSKEIL